MVDATTIARHASSVLAALAIGAAVNGCTRWPPYPEGTGDQPHQAAPRGSAAAAKAKPSTPAPPPNVGMETLVEAAQAGNLERVKELLSKDASRQTLNEALFATAAFSPLIVGPVNAQREFGLRHAQIVRLLLAKGANLEARVRGDETPLMAAAGLGQTEVVRVLLEKGAEIEATGSAGMTALAGAACDCAIADMPDTYDSMKLLLEHGANVEAMDRRGYTPLMRAAGWGRVENAQLLLDNGAEIDAATNHGDTALLISVSGGPQVTELLLKRGANIEARNEDGDTALILASGRGIDEAEIVKLLLDHGADVRAKNNKGRAALDLAVRNGRSQIVALLKAAAAKPY